MKPTFRTLYKHSGTLFNLFAVGHQSAPQQDAPGRPYETSPLEPRTSTWRRLAVLQVVAVPSATLPLSVHVSVTETEVLYLIAALRERISPIGLCYLRRTKDGLLAVYDDPAAALNAARTLRRRKPSAGIRIRYALFWGDAYVGADGAPASGEALMLRQILSLKPDDRKSSAGDIELPDRDRVLMPFGAVVQLPVELRAQFVPLGLYNLPGYACPIEIWTENLAAFLGREPTHSEELFGADGLHRDTVLDLRWERRYEILDKSVRR